MFQGIRSRSDISSSPSQEMKLTLMCPMPRPLKRATELCSESVESPSLQFIFIRSVYYCPISLSLSLGFRVGVFC